MLCRLMEERVKCNLDKEPWPPEKEAEMKEAEARSSTGICLLGIRNSCE